MNKIIVRGTQSFMGMEIPVVEGGFGEGKRCLTDKTISNIHGMQPKNVRARITDNLKRFKENIDVIDLKRAYDTSTLIELGYAKQSITQAEHIYLLSERGYAKLIKIMDTDLAWEIHDKLIDEYFTMREIINSAQSSSLELYNEGLRKDQQMLDEDREILDQWKKATATPKRVTNIYVNAIKRELGVDSAKHKDYINVKEMILEYFEVGTLEALPKNNIEVLNKIVQTCRNYNPGYSQISMFDED